MGFPDHLSLAAASKFPDDVGEAMDWIMTKQAVDKMEDVDKDNDPPLKHNIASQNKQNIQSYQYEEANGYNAENEDDDEDNEINEINENENEHQNDKDQDQHQHQNQYNDDDKNYFEQNQEEDPINNNNKNPFQPSLEPLQDADKDSIDKYKQHSLHLSLKNNHSNSISEAISTADIVIKGEYNPDASPDSMLIISDLISAVLNEDENDLGDKYPDHMIKPFMRWTNKIRDVKLNKMYYAEICQYLLVDHKRVKNLYAFDKINQVFKNVETIESYHTGWINKFYLELLLKILDNIRYLEYSKLHKIYLNDINNMGSMDNDIDKYKLLFRQKNWDIQKGVSNLIVSRYYG